MQPQDILSVRNGFDSDWRPSGYRDVKVNPVVNGHLCEVQLQLKNFNALKAGQHVVYEWARDLRVTTEIEPEHLVKNVSPAVTQEMIRLASCNWRGTRGFLANLLDGAGQYVQGEEILKEVFLRQYFQSFLHPGQKDYSVKKCTAHSMVSFVCCNRRSSRLPCAIHF